MQSICTVMLLFVVHHKVNSLEKYNIPIISSVTSRPRENGAEIGILEDIDLFVVLSLVCRRRRRVRNNFWRGWNCMQMMYGIALRQCMH